MGKKTKNNSKKKARAPVATSSGRSTEASSPFKNIEDLPAFHDASPKDSTKTSRRTSGHDIPVVGLYERYKSATTAFRTWLAKVLPSRVSLRSVTDLSHACNQILTGTRQVFLAEADEEVDLRIPNEDNDTLPLLPMIAVPRETLSLLDDAIAVRQQVARLIGPRADEGHEFFIETLQYCRRVLGLCRNVQRVMASMYKVKHKRHAASPPKKRDDLAVPDKEEVPTKNDTDRIGGRFQALILEDEDEDDEIEEADQKERELIRKQQIPNIAPPKEPSTAFTIDELIRGDDRFQACAFLFSMDQIMELVDGQYKVLKGYMRGSDLHEAPSYLHLLLECTVVTNMAMESVAVLEAELAANFPHLGSFYNVLAIVFLPHFIADLDQLIQPSIRAKHPQLAKTAMGDIVECSFHNMGQRLVPDKIKRFVKTAKITDRSQVDRILGEAKIAVDMEVQTQRVEAKNFHMNSMFRSAGLRPHMWLQSNFFIGGDRCILNTQCLIQRILDIAKSDSKLVSHVPNYFGNLWDETVCPARRIRGDMDQLLAGDILPELIEIGRHMPMDRLPHTKELCPLMCRLAMQVRNEGSAVSISLTFGIHAMLTSLFVLQGSGDVKKLMTSTKRSFHRLFEQLKEEPNNPHHPIFYSNVTRYKHLFILAKPLGPLCSATSEVNAFWNPLVGGGLLLYATYVASIGLGCATVDCLGQLRLSLHVYNAMVKQNLLQPDDAPLLRNLNSVFCESKTVWAGLRPEKGSFVKCFWIAWGTSIRDATRRANNARTGESKMADPRKDNTRILERLVPDQYSHSFRRIVLRDFSQDMDEFCFRKNTVKEKKEANRALFELIDRVNMTRDSMDKDEDYVIPVNFTKVGCILNDFVHGLNSEMGWERFIKSMVESCPDEIRNGVRTNGKRVKPGDFATTDVNLERQSIAQMIASELGKLDSHDDAGEASGSSVKAAQYMKRFFGGLTSDDYSFFEIM